MSDICPVCRQALPQAIDKKMLQTNLEKLTSAAKKEAQDKLEADYAERLSIEQRNARLQAEKSAQEQIAKIRADMERQIVKAKKVGAVEAEQLMKSQLEDARRQLADAAKRSNVEIERARKEAQDAAQREIRLIRNKATFDNDNKLKTLQLKREQEHNRHQADMAKLQGKLDDLSRKLQKQSPEQFGEEGEIDLYTELLRKFPTDKIERVGKGVKGADILHRVMAGGGKQAGCIVYESKNVTTWQNAFIAQAKKYHTQYSTPYVMIVSRVFPKKQRGMCVEQNIPVVEPHFAVALASVMREGIIEISKLQLTKTGTDEKAQELFAYIVGNEFQMKFREMSYTVKNLMDLQQTEKSWHDKHWAKESELQERISKRHSEINAKMQLMLEGVSDRKLMAVAVGQR
ncbi:MAG TPA: DUF2130 domain-containing protein [Candidatus Angelobacter sp.]|nr:DUF2130 domain-containing protein [Candidatus Angelobacter sp.]